MKKLFYPLLLGFTTIMVACIFLFAKDPADQVPAFRERTGEIALTGEWLNTRKAIEGLFALLADNPKNTGAMVQLAQAYIQEGRISGNHGYYDKAATELLNRVLKVEPENFNALCCKATVQLSQHHFAEALATGIQAQKINPHSAFIYGVLCDGNLELGHYELAIRYADKMVSIRPDIRSYARISYLREIHGDLPGAISAMKLAASAGYPGLEETEWTRCMLGQLYEYAGCMDSANVQYELALLERPFYPFALFGLSQVEKSKGQYTNAIHYVHQALSNMQEPQFSAELTALLELSGQKAAAQKNAAKVVEMLMDGNSEEGEDGHGHYADKELAYAYLKLNDADAALKHARLEHKRRPLNIEANEVLAWAQFHQGDCAEANTNINKALRTGSKNPVMLYHAALIKEKAGEVERARALMKEAARYIGIRDSKSSDLLVQQF